MSDPRVPSQRARMSSSPSSAIASCTASSWRRNCCAPSSSSDPTAAGSPAQMRTSRPSVTRASAVVSVSRTSPYRTERTSGGTACISAAMSWSRAARASRATSNSVIASPTSASRACSMSSVRRGRSAPRASEQTFATVAAATVVPHTEASTTSTAKSGRHASSHVSRKVPVERTCPTVVFPHRMPSRPSRCSSRERSRSVGVRRSRSLTAGTGSRFIRSRRVVAARSLSSGTVGVPSGTSPSASPTTNRRVTRSRVTSLPSQITARVASVTSASPASGRPRSTARVSARRTASITWALDTGRSSARSTAATWVSQSATVCSGVANRCAYQPGDSTPAP